MAVRRQAILQEPCRYYAPLSNPLVCSYSENAQQETRNKDGRERGGMVPMLSRKISKARWSVGGAFVMTDSAKLPVRWLKCPLHSGGRNIYIFENTRVSSPYRWLINPDLMPRLLEL